MNLEEIELKSMDKLFEYEKNVRIIDNLSEEDLKLFAKCYCKLYLAQQEVLMSMQLI